MRTKLAAILLISINFLLIYNAYLLYVVNNQCAKFTGFERWSLIIEYVILIPVVVFSLFLNWVVFKSVYFKKLKVDWSYYFVCFTILLNVRLMCFTLLFLSTTFYEKPTVGKLIGLFFFGQ
jgi:hypothetical protein